MSLPYTVRLVVYDPNGARRAHLPDVLSCSPTSPFNDVGSLQFSYPKTGRNVDLLTGFFEIGVEIDHGDGYVEPDGFRFVSMGWSDEGTENAGEIAFDLPSYGWLLKRAAVLSGLDEDGRRVFEGANAGHIMATLINECRARGALAGLSFTFTGSHGSNGAPWTVSQSIEYTPGNDLSSILEALADQGLCDWTTKGRQLYLVPADTASVDRSGIVLRYGVDLTEGPNKRDATNLVHSIVVGGEGSTRVVVNQGGGTPAPWGLFEEYLSVSGVEDAGYLTQAGQIALAGGAKAGEQLTRTVQLADSPYAPLRDFDVGDWIRAPGMDGSIQKLRVREIAVTKDSNGVGAALLLSDRFLHEQVQQRRRQDQIEQAVYDSSFDSGSTIGDWSPTDWGSVSDVLGMDDWTPGDPSVFDRLDGLTTDYGALDERLSYLEQCCQEVGGRLDAIEDRLSLGGDVQIFSYSGGSLIHSTDPVDAWGFWRANDTRGTVPVDEPGHGHWTPPSVGSTVTALAIGSGGDGGWGAYGQTSDWTPHEGYTFEGGQGGGCGGFGRVTGPLTQFTFGLPAAEADPVNVFVAPPALTRWNTGIRQHFEWAPTGVGGGTEPGGVWFGFHKLATGGQSGRVGLVSPAVRDDLTFGRNGQGWTTHWQEDPPDWITSGPNSLDPLSTAHGAGGGAPGQDGEAHAVPVRDPADPDRFTGLEYSGGGVAPPPDPPPEDFPLWPYAGPDPNYSTEPGGAGKAGYWTNSDTATFGGGGAGGAGVDNSLRIGPIVGFLPSVPPLPPVPVFGPPPHAAAGDGGDGGWYGAGGGGGGSNAYSEDVYPSNSAEDPNRVNIRGLGGRGASGVLIVITR